jgi:hypothetical protein
MLGSPYSYMTLQLLPPEFPIYEENFLFFFISAAAAHSNNTCMAWNAGSVVQGTDAVSLEYIFINECFEDLPRLGHRLGFFIIVSRSMPSTNSRTWNNTSSALLPTMMLKVQPQNSKRPRLKMRPYKGEA